MFRTRKIGRHRRKTTHRRRNTTMKGGGRLIRLPLGSNARNADGNPRSILVRALGPAGGAGVAAAAPLLLGTPEAYSQGRNLATRRAVGFPKLYNETAQVANNEGLTNEERTAKAKKAKEDALKHLTFVEKALPALETNFKRGYTTKNVYLRLCCL